MRVLLSTSFLPASSTDKLPQFIREQASSLAEGIDDLEIRVVAASRSAPESTIHPRVTVKRFNYWFSPSSQNLTNMGIMPAIKANRLNIIQLPFLFVFEAIAMLLETARFKPHYIYSHWFLPQALINHYICKLFHIPHLFTSHSYDVEICRKLPFIGKWLVRCVINNLAAGSAVSQRTLNGIASFYSEDEWRIISKKFIVLPMGTYLPSTEQKPRANGGRSKLLCMGRLVEKKGIHYLLEAIAELSLDYVEIELTIAGDGPELENLKKQCKKLGIINRVYFPGFISGKEKHDAFMQHDIYILPSIVAENGDREGLPVSLIEALAHGKLCIATEGSGAEELITDGSNGLLCRSNSSEQLAKSIQKALTMPSDDFFNISYGAVETAKKTEWKHINEIMAAHYFGISLPEEEKAKHKPLISVLIPAFNCDEHIEQAVTSITNQNYSNLEILICDDGSSDKTWHVINTFTDPRIRKFRHTENQGYLASINFLFEKCAGQLITFQDADDISQPHRISELYRQFSQDPDLTICGSYCEKIYTNTKKRLIKYPEKNVEITKQLEQGETALFCGASIMFRREVLKSLGGYDPFFCRIGAEDIDWYIRILEKKKGKNIPYPLYLYRQTPGSISQSLTSNPIKEHSPDIAYTLHLARKSQKDEKTKRNIKNIVTKTFPAIEESENTKNILGAAQFLDINSSIKYFLQAIDQKEPLLPLIKYTLKSIVFLCLEPVTPSRVLRKFVSIKRKARSHMLYRLCLNTPDHSSS